MPSYMPDQDKESWLVNKKKFLDKQKHTVRSAIAQGREVWDQYNQWMSVNDDPNDSLDENTFDLEKAAQRLNDYEKELLCDCLGSKDSFFELVQPGEGTTRLQLKTKLGLVKEYKDREEIEAYSTLIRKNQLQRVKGSVHSFHLNWRGTSVYKRSKEIEKFEAEELEGMRGLGSFYDFSSVL